jgi:hypothetical protein
MTTREPDCNADAMDDAVLALLWVNMVRDGEARRAWKTFPWEATDRLFEKGLISDPKSAAKSVILTDEGIRRAQEVAARLFATKTGNT